MSHQIPINSSAQIFVFFGVLKYEIHILKIGKVYTQEYIFLNNEIHMRHLFIIKILLTSETVQIGLNAEHEKNIISKNGKIPDCQTLPY